MKDGNGGREGGIQTTVPSFKRELIQTDLCSRFTISYLSAICPCLALLCLALCLPLFPPSSPSLLTSLYGTGFGEGFGSPGGGDGGGALSRTPFVASLTAQEPQRIRRTIRWVDIMNRLCV